MRRILFLTASPRAHSNSEMLARRAAEGLAPGTATHWQSLTTPALPAFRDLRPGHAGVPMGRLGDLFAHIMLATDIVFVAPIYWYAFPAPLHLLMSHLSGWLDVPELKLHSGLQGKAVYLITAHADPDPTVPDQAEALLKRSAIWLGLSWRGALHGVADAPGEMPQSAVWDSAPDFLMQSERPRS